MKQDKIIVCQDCQSEFAWTMGEQEFFKKQGLTEPVRCMVCRATFKAAQQDQFRGQVKEMGKE